MSTNWKNVNNWHWVNKNCLNWTQAYFEKELVGLEAEKDGSKVKITSVDECTGDVDLNQRKGKIITIYDVAIKLSWEGTTSDGTTGNGKIFIPEVAHDTDPDDYVFDISVNADSNEKQPLRDTIKKKLTPLISKKFEGFAKDLIKEHGSDVYIAKDEMGAAAPTRGAEHVAKEKTTINKSQPTTTITTTTAAPAEKGSSKVNTTTLEDTVEFQTSAHELYETLLDTQRVCAWTRCPAKISKEKGSKFELFNGNVRGELLDAVPDKKIVQSWRLQSWPEGHFSTVTMTLDQGNDSVQLHVKQTGVPIGEEELTERNWTGYYWRSIKQTFGFGAVF
ncbi:chaperone activator aha1 [Lichtheimia corymbifera JMRC:FSU:9682]|uniref:Chaperone activator aha1 n=1 Tax=Lichtheimia corymbifera JMRC:FSU:9682 TaxID=1263082 RepID=A0A068RPF3_9FUNG|nr:chaperone activator aha1 [Lichtheimia corymbifera JMRC:FSU:9682]